jgi:hypothetical protein
MADYGIRLRDAAVAYAENNSVTDELDRPKPPAGQAHVVISAPCWCGFWSERGHGMVADL